MRRQLKLYFLNDLMIEYKYLKAKYIQIYGSRVKHAVLIFHALLDMPGCRGERVWARLIWERCLF